MRTRIILITIISAVLGLYLFSYSYYLSNTPPIFSLITHSFMFIILILGLIIIFKEKYLKRKIILFCILFSSIVIGIISSILLNNSNKLEYPKVYNSISQ